MFPRVKHWQPLLAGVALISAQFDPAANAQQAPQQGQPTIAQAADQAAAKALDLLNSGKLPEAEQAYTALVSQYPNSGVFPEALFRLGYTQYMQGEYPAALITLARVQSPPAAPEIKAAADALIPQVTAAQAQAKAATDPTRADAFQKAMKQFADFVQKYPNSQQVESAAYGEAMAAYQIQDYATAEKALAENLDRFAGSDTIFDSEDLLAVALTADADAMIKAAGNSGDKDAAFSKYTEALDHLVHIIQSQTDPGVANDAQFQVGEILFARGNARTGEEQASDFKHAILAYRAVQAQSAIVEALEARLTEAQGDVHTAQAAHDPAAVREAQRRLDRANGKLSAAKQAPDQLLNAKLRIAACYYLTGKFDESRAMLNYLAPLVTNNDEKKQISFYRILTYVSQGIMEKAEAQYRDFTLSYRADPLGESLPLIVGSAYLSGTNPQPEKAVIFLDQERQLYPASPLVNTALNEETSAMLRQKKYDDAIVTYRQFLSTNPSPAQAATAEQGIGQVFQQSGRVPEAVKQYNQVVTDFPGTPAAEESAFYAAALDTSLDMKQAMTELQAYVAKYPDGKFTPKALLTIGQVQATQGDGDAALQTYKNVIEKFPKSDSAPQAYFQEASQLARDGRTEEMAAVLRDFINAYPDDKQVYFAFDTIGQNQITAGDMAGAAQTYAEMATDHADDPMAPNALCRVAELWRQSADAQGHYQALDDDQRRDWRRSITSSLAAGEKVLAQYPDSPQAGVALKTLLADQEMLVDAGRKEPQGVLNYFHELAGRYSRDAAAESRVQFTLAIYTYQTDPAAGLAAMTKVYNPSLGYAPADLDVYGMALIGQGKAAQAYSIYQKIAADFPLPDGLRPSQAQPATQEAQAIALFGMATALDKQGKTADSGKLFSQLKTDYPWSPKVVEANFGIAKSLMDDKKYDDASKLLIGIVGSHTATPALRADSFLMIGDLQTAKGNFEAAIDSYLKTALYYSGVPAAAVQGLWRGGQMLERQAATLTEQTKPKQSEQIAKAVNAYRTILRKYPTSELVSQAKERIKELGATP